MLFSMEPECFTNPNLSFDENISNQKAALPPCHAFQRMFPTTSFLANYTKKVQMFSWSTFCSPHALLTMMVAQVCNYKPGDFVHTFGDVHIYSNHEEQVKEQLSRSPKPLLL